VLQQRTAAQKPAENRIAYDTLLAFRFFSFPLCHELFSDFIRGLKIQFSGLLKSWFLFYRLKNQSTFR